MLGPFTFTFTLESEEFEKFEKVACAALDLYQTMINTRAPDGANTDTIQHKSPQMITKEASDWMGIMF